MNWFQHSKLKLSAILTLAVMLTMIISTVASAEVWTDQEDYAPGSVVTLGGNNDENGAPGYVEGNSVDVEWLDSRLFRDGRCGWRVVVYDHTRF